MDAVQHAISVRIVILNWMKKGFARAAIIVFDAVHRLTSIIAVRNATIVPRVMRNWTKKGFVPIVTIVKDARNLKEQIQPARNVPANL